jgi:RNA polymerase sigma-70 factor, ECF subfamily
MREFTLTDMERLGAFDEAERTFQMTEEAFRTFYELTARPVRVYLSRMTGDDRLADDLLQETYYRFLRSNATFENDDHRRRYLYRIATNLVHDHRRRPHIEVASPTLPEPRPIFTEPNVAERAARRIDLQRALARLKPRERSMLWLAYALGWSHEEIAASIGVKAGSMKPMLHRARQRLAGLLNPSTRGSRSGGPPATRSGQGRS